MLTVASPVGATETCDLVAAQAAQESGVPLPIMAAITRAETRNGNGDPWPWTINHAGQGEWFDTADQALTRIDALLGAGESLDIGCFQINTRWHAGEFASAADMLDPLTNARYAARYLLELYGESGDWKAAVAAYHSRDPDRGAGYAERVALIMREFGTPVASVAEDLPRANGFPLLLAGDPVSHGSLFGAVGLQSPLVGP